MQQNLIPTIRMKQVNMTVTEQRIVDWLLNPRNITPKTPLSKAASSLKVSEALVVKVAKLLGFKGFRELRSILSANFAAQSFHENELCTEDSTEDLINKVFNLSQQTLKEGQSIVATNIIEQAAHCFFNAKQRDLYGVGGSTPICDDIGHKFLRLGIRCNTYRDIHFMMMSASLLTPEDVVLVVSHSGKTNDLLRAVGIARENGAKIICITNSNISPLAELSDYVICTPAPDTPLLGKNASARILQLILVDALFMAIAKQDLSLSTQNLAKTAYATQCFRQK